MGNGSQVILPNPNRKAHKGEDGVEMAMALPEEVDVGRSTVFKQSRREDSESIIVRLKL